MNSIRRIRQTVGSAIEEVAVTAPQLIKIVVVSAGDTTIEINDKVLEPTEQRFADRYGYTHGGKREKIVKHLVGVSKYESGARFFRDHVVDAMRKDYDGNKFSKLRKFKLS